VAPILLPRLSPGTATVVRVIVAGVPALVSVVVAVVILLVALFMSAERQRYALRAANSMFKLAATMTRLPGDRGT
jgi:hypothetical protein